jgi:uncharacterized protein YbaP (TraB family)
MRTEFPRQFARLLSAAGLGLCVFLAASGVRASAPQTKAVDHAIFWAIERAGRPAGYLLGTIHSEDPRVVDFAADFIPRLKENQVFAMELVPDARTLTRLQRYMSLPPDTTLESVVGAKRYAAAAAALARYKVAPEAIEHLKPWAVMMTLSTPPPVTGFFMDMSLSLRAEGMGLKVVGLETLDEQLSFLDEMPLDMQLSLLDQAIADTDQVDAMHEKMVKAYLENDLQQLQALSNREFNSAGACAGNYFERLGINARNHRMLQALLPLLAKQRVFVAVGALHLPGKEGLLTLLRQAGFDLRPLAMPLMTTATASAPADG